MRLFLQDIINLARKNCKITRFDQNLARKLSCKFFLQDFTYLARKASFLVQDLQDLVQDLASLERKNLTRFGYFLQDGF